MCQQNNNTKSKKYKVNTTYMRQLLEQTGEEDEEL